MDGKFSLIISLAVVPDKAEGMGMAGRNSQRPARTTPPDKLEKGVAILTARRTIGLILLAFLFSLALLPALGQAADDPIAQADELYGKRKDHANVNTAINILAKYLEKQPGNYEALWRVARGYWFLGDRASGKDKLPLYEKGKGYAEQAVQANEKGLDGHHWFGSLIGCVGQEKGILNSLFMVKPMKKEIEACLAIDPKYADAHDVMAQLLWKVPGFAGGNSKKAQEEARLATVYGPDATDHWLHYGQIAASNKDYKTARPAFQKCLDLPGDPEDPEGSQNDKAEAREELKKIEGK